MVMCIHNPPITLNDTILDRWYAVLVIGTLEA